MLSHVPTSERVLRRVISAFDRPIIQNNLRGFYIEYMVAELLAPNWHHCGDDWASWDLVSETGTRLEIKQSAAVQSWAAPDTPARSPRFSIARKNGHFEGAKWNALSGRPADVYCFAWHQRTDALADQRDPAQWEFYVIPSDALPEQKSISLKTVRAIGVCADSDNLHLCLSTYITVC